MRWMTVPLPDGRELDVLASDRTEGMGLLFHHGTPGNATRYETWFIEAEARGLRPVAYSRPGCATSTRDPGRRVSSAVSDVTAVLDAVGIDQFVSIGGSGGGPHVIACAALMPDRCGAAAALAGEAALREWMAANGEVFRHVTGPELIAAMGDGLAPVDQAVATGEWADHEALGMRRSLKHGFDGWVDDDLAFTEPWGFEVEAITTPVHIWQGELDRLVPWTHGQWLADHIPGASFRLALGHGHFSLGVANRSEILGELVAAAGA